MYMLWKIISLELKNYLGTTVFSLPSMLEFTLGRSSRSRTTAPIISLPWDFISSFCLRFLIWCNIFRVGRVGRLFDCLSARFVFDEDDDCLFLNILNLNFLTPWRSHKKVLKFSFFIEVFSYNFRTLPNQSKYTLIKTEKVIYFLGKRFRFFVEVPVALSTQFKQVLIFLC